MFGNLFQRPHRGFLLASVILSGVAGQAAWARPGGSLAVKKGWVSNTVTVTGAAGKTNWTMEWQGRNGGTWGTSTVTGSVSAGGSGSGSYTNSGGPPWSGDNVRARFDNGSTSTPTVVAVGIVDLQSESIICAAGVPQTFSLPATLRQNYAEGLEFGTTNFVAGTSFTLSLPQGFSWVGTPGATTTSSADLGVGSPLVSGQDLSIPILYNNHLDPMSGFSLTGAMVSFSGNSFGSALPQFLMSGTASLGASVAPFSLEWTPVAVLPTPATATLLGLGGLMLARRRRRVV